MGITNSDTLYNFTILKNHSLYSIIADTFIIYIISLVSLFKP